MADKQGEWNLLSRLGAVQWRDTERWLRVGVCIMAPLVLTAVDNRVAPLIHEAGRLLLEKTSGEASS